MMRMNMRLSSGKHQWLVAAIVAAVFSLNLAPNTASAATRLYSGTRLAGETVVTMETGSSKTITFTYRNAGSRAWKNTGRGFISAYQTRPTVGSKPTAILREATVSPGRSGTFAVTLYAPQTAGTYVKQYQLASENVAWIFGTAVKVTMNVVDSKITRATPVNAKAYAVTDAATGAMLMERAPDEVRSVASLTKLVTYLTAKQAGLDQSKIISMEAGDEVGGGRLRMAYGSRLTVGNLVAASLVGSANNSTNSLARATGLPREEFIARMNRMASSLGMSRSSFVDPTGIEVENFSTARDIATLARAAFKDELVARLTSSATYPIVSLDYAEPREIKNTNTLISDGRVQVLAGKTGFINEAGYTLVVSLHKKGERDLIVVVLGADTKELSFRDARILAEQAWLE